ncbi:MAG TPA: TerC/Alx family metal homeostasis membrane protein [Ferruginibacter sp.]|jgi:tellurite resistance protein TerC|nr:TerC/Alx family metal homeostasis membrane protein [Ferruginibacter sp.]MBN8698135.1 TerC/Alx family metal homeostasis membrane protein [Chitinophagales bacterium]HMX79174.1 TerC/Alx family metal homeostasis membrane protein [Ferruginibacter sp.]HNA00404.1 TerC/Alx family metal homeostasis membrane protein [Ferruginibacter sp.]HNJ28079.1 TerC/Alx family metal homeostasis membrane protein [Ferruginibacter sp.]
MDKTQLIYIVFSAVIVLALVFDLGLLSKKNKEIGLKAALMQTIFWVALSFVFCGFIWFENDGGNGREDAIAYISAYLLEWSLSIDNIFVFIIIFSFFKVKPANYSRVLLLGILMAIVFRIIFIAIGSELVARFHWVMYIFGAFILLTGIKMFSSGDEKEFDPAKNWAYRFMNRFMRITHEEPHGRFVITHNKKAYFTTLSMVVVMLGLIDIMFALDSIPAVFSIIPNPDKKLLIYSSNIFAVLGLRSLFFLLRGAASKFDFLQQGIAIVLVFIGVKMLIADWVHIPVWISLLVIVCCISGSVIYSIYHQRKGVPRDIKSD